MPYRFDLPVSPQQLRAIGMVAVEWSYLESVMDAAIGTFAGIYREDVWEAMTAHLTGRSRLDMLATLFRLTCKIDSEWGPKVDPLFQHKSNEIKRRSATFEGIYKKIDRLSGERNKIVHSRWVRRSQGSPMVYEVRARGTLQRFKYGKSEDEMLHVAAQIAEQSNQLRSLFEIPLMGPGPRGPR